MKAIGKIQIEEGLILNSPTMEINNISYEQLTNKVNIEVLFNEENAIHKHSRTFTFENPTGKDLVYTDILELIKTNNVLNKFI